MKEEIIEENKVIADFMGVQWQMMNNRLFISDDNGQSWYGKLYDKDWNYLMPVLERIRALAYNKDLEDHKELYSRWKPIANELENLNLKNVHFCSFKFIEYFNSQKETIKH